MPVGHHRHVAVRLDPDDTAVAVLADRQPALGVERQAVRARLVIAADVDARVAALRAEHCHAPSRVPAIDRVGVGRAEQQRAVRRPHRTLGELEPARHALEARARGHDGVQPRVDPLDRQRRLALRPRPRGRVEVERGRAHPDVVVRGGRDRPVDPEHGDLDALARASVVGEHHAVGRVEASDHRPAGVAELVGQHAVDPDLGVVVDRDLEHHRGAGGVELTEPLGNGHLDPIPVEAHAPVGEP